MSVKSYLVFPSPGKEHMLLKNLASFKNCQITPSRSKEVIILITDTEKESEEEEVLAQIQSMDGFHHISLVSGFSTE